MSTPSAGEDAEEQRNSHSLLVGTQNGAATLEGSLAVFYEAKSLMGITFLDI